MEGSPIVCVRPIDFGAHVDRLGVIVGIALCIGIILDPLLGKITIFGPFLGQLKQFWSNSLYALTFLDKLKIGRFCVAVISQFVQTFSQA